MPIDIFSGGEYNNSAGQICSVPSENIVRLPAAALEMSGSKILFAYRLRLKNVRLENFLQALSLKRQGLAFWSEDFDISRWLCLPHKG